MERATATRPWERVRLFGMDIDSVGFAEVIHLIEDLTDAHQPCYAVTPNVDHLMRLQSGRQFQEAYRHTALVPSDGMPLAGVYGGVPLYMGQPHVRA